MANKFTTFLDAVGQKTKQVLGFIFTKALPIATQAAQMAEPIIDLAFPALGPEFNLVVTAVAQTEASWAAVNQESGTGAQKMAEVLADVKTQLLPKLTQAGLTSAEAEAKVEAYVQAVVQILNTFPVATVAAAPKA